MGDSVDNNIRHSIFLSLVFAHEVLSFSIIKQNPNDLLIVTLLSSSLILLILLHYSTNKQLKKLYYVLPFVQVLLVIAVDYMAKSSDFQIIIVIAVASIVNDYPLKFSKVFFWIPLVIYQGTATIKILEASNYITSDDLIGYIIQNSITYLLVIFTFYSAKKHLILNTYLQFLMSDLKDKTQKLEEVIILKERNRIAREIHDALGHTLTGAIIQLEAAKKLDHVDQKKNSRIN